MIHILLASYRGEQYLPAQVESICAQKTEAISLLISDDDSARDTELLLSRFSESLKIKVISGPQRGVNANFLNLIKHAPLNPHCFYAFADQDDVWLPQKLQTAQTQIESYIEKHPNRPVVYMGRTMVCDESLQPLYLSKGKPQLASFNNALLESIAGGNTMVFNAPALSLLQTLGQPVHHDWFTYMVVTACGGEVFFDDTPYVLYRQHDENVIGASRGLKAKLLRFKKILSGEFRIWTHDNLVALTPLVPRMTESNQRTFAGFKRLHEIQGWHNCLRRLYLFINLRLYRQRLIDHFGLMLAAFLGRI